MPITIRCYALSLLVLVVALTGCSYTPPQKQTPIWDTHAQQSIDIKQLGNELKKVDYLMIGEFHDEPALSAQLVPLLTQMKKNQAIDVLAFDSLSPDTNTLSAAFSHQYQPLIQWAEQNNVTVIGVKPYPHKTAALKSAPEQQAFLQSVSGALSKDAKQALCEALTGCHGANEQPPSKKARYLLAAQQYKDNAMAEALLQQKKQVVLITRAFHARNDLGVKPYIQYKHPNSTVKTLLVDSDTDSLPSLAPYVDYVWGYKPNNDE